EVVTLASIIEKEAMLPEERPIISAVFHNRLRLKRPLESCATVQYALGYHKPKLTYDDLEINSPYNTYRNAGLPPAPIANPGLDSILAALYPAEVDYLYFVAKSDGSHVFTKTYNDHLRAQRNLK
ncbi:MAG TPA: endolytic transglycosylase MltG, partial [Firmicutes bacterium]|nr:endolytic transglycosylase MltG [Bacillota bacterium]HCT37538.1 endolytic transglycosylase MltG [Bacillota bacterium]